MHLGNWPSIHLVPQQMPRNTLKLLAVMCLSLATRVSLESQTYHIPIENSRAWFCKRGSGLLTLLRGGTGYCCRDLKSEKLVLLTVTTIVFLALRSNFVYIKGPLSFESLANFLSPSSGWKPCTLTPKVTLAQGITFWFTDLWRYSF